MGGSGAVMIGGFIFLYRHFNRNGLGLGAVMIGGFIFLYRHFNRN
ncbi:hypothetical protein [Dehalococcoides mccartyi]|nr:hypothetical protein [Dehalococcoides mccartyi]